MRLRAYGSVLVCLLGLCAADSAQGYAFQYRVNLPPQPPGNLALAVTSDTVSVDLYLDAEPGLNSFEIGVLWDDALYEYDPSLNTAPSYILYDPDAGMAAASHLFPNGTWSEWPTPPPGRAQANVRFLSSGGFDLPASASGQDIWVASLIFHVTQPVYLDSFEVSLGVGGTGVFVGGNRSTIPLEQLDPADVPITRLPEPLTATLLGAAIALAAAFGFRVPRRARGDVP